MADAFYAELVDERLRMRAPPPCSTSTVNRSGGCGVGADARLLPVRASGRVPHLPAGFITARGASALRRGAAPRPPRIMVACMQNAGCSLFVYLLGQIPRSDVFVDVWAGCSMPEAPARGLANASATIAKWPVCTHYREAKDPGAVCALPHVGGRVIWADAVARYQPTLRILFIRDPLQTLLSILGKQFYCAECGHPSNKLAKLDRLWHARDHEFDAVFFYEGMANTAHAMMLLRRLDIELPPDATAYTRDAEDINEQNALDGYALPNDEHAGCHPNGAGCFYYSYGDIHWHALRASGNESGYPDEEAIAAHARTRPQPRELDVVRLAAIAPELAELYGGAWRAHAAGFAWHTNGSSQPGGTEIRAKSKRPECELPRIKSPPSPPLPPYASDSPEPQSRQRSKLSTPPMPPTLSPPPQKLQPPLPLLSTSSPPMPLPLPTPSLPSQPHAVAGWYRQATPGKHADEGLMGAPMLILLALSVLSAWLGRVRIRHVVVQTCLAGPTATPTGGRVHSRGTEAEQRRCERSHLAQ